MFFALLICCMYVFILESSTDIGCVLGSAPIDFRYAKLKVKIKVSRDAEMIKQWVGELNHTKYY